MSPAGARRSLAAVLGAVSAVCFALIGAGEVIVEAEGRCVDRARVRELITSSSSIAADYDVAVIERAGARGFVVELRVIGAEGEVPLDRRFEIAREDCASVPELVATVLRRFFDQLPAMLRAREEPTQQPAPPPPAVVIERERRVREEVSALSGDLFAALSSRWLPIGADLELGGALSVGSDDDRLVAGAALRVATPSSLGSGHLLATAALLGVGWRHAIRETWQLQLEARAGAILVRGLDYDQNASVWLPWIEAQAALYRDFGAISLGVEAGVSPLEHTISVQGVAETTRISPIRLGIGLIVPIFHSLL